MKKIKNLKDGQQFKLSKRSKVIYELNRKFKGKASFTSLTSKRTFIKEQSTVVYPV